MESQEASIAIVDYGAGNLTSVKNAFAALGVETVVTRDPAVVAAAARVVFPGVGAALSAMESLRAKKDSPALQQVVLDIIVSTGIVSNLVSHVPEYYYNSTLAHGVYYGSTVTRKGENHLHGEVVSLGVLCLYTYAKDFAMRDKLMAFNAQMGLPVCFDDVEIDEDEFPAMADKFETTVEWAHRPKDVTREGFIQCMKDQNAAGRVFKEKQA